MPVHLEFVLPRLAARHAVIFEDQPLERTLLVEQIGGTKAGSAAAHHDDVVAVFLHGQGTVVHLVEPAVANPVRTAQHVPGIAVRTLIIADAARAVEAPRRCPVYWRQLHAGLRREQFPGRQTTQQGAAGTEQHALPGNPAG